MKYPYIMLLLIWIKGRPIPGLCPNLYRADDFGRVMRSTDYGLQNSPFGWQVDHIIPVSFGGQTILGNLRPLHFFSNTSMGGHIGNLLKFLKARA